MGCGMVRGLIRLIPTSFWFVMIRSTGASWFLPTQGVVLWHAPIGAPMLMRHSSALRSLIHMDRRVAWHLMKKVMMSTIKKRNSIGLRLSFSFLGPMVNTKADLNIICIYFKCFLSVQLVKVFLSVLVISSYFFSLPFSLPGYWTEWGAIWSEIICLISWFQTKRAYLSKEKYKPRNGLKDLLRNSLDTAYYSVRKLWKENSWDNCIEILSYFANHTR